MVYTRMGDKGKTSLVEGKRVWKDDIEIEVYGTLDELLAILGCTYAKVQSEKVRRDLQKIMNDLHNLFSDIAEYKGKISHKEITFLEDKIKEYNKILKPIKYFILEVSSESATMVNNLARTVCRRAERRLVSLSKQKPIKSILLAYLNRSDFLFILSLYLNTVEEIP